VQHSDAETMSTTWRAVVSRGMANGRQGRLPGTACCAPTEPYNCLRRIRLSSRSVLTVWAHPAFSAALSHPPPGKLDT
jgi:hypothetical protein